MKDTNLQTPELHDFSDLGDLKFNLPKPVAIAGIIVGLVLLYGVLRPFGSSENAEAAGKSAPRVLAKS
jgi:hypothetical protein